MASPDEPRARVLLEAGTKVIVNGVLVELAQDAAVLTCEAEQLTADAKED